MELRLEVTIDGSTTVVGPDERPVIVGRDDRCDITIGHPSVSAEHGEFTVADGRWIYRDRSTYGSYVGEARVAEIVISEPVEIRLAEPTNGPLVAVRPLDPVTAPARGAPGSLLATRPVAKVTAIGRSERNDVVLADDLTVSRRHAELRATPAGFEVVDLGSQAGTFVNGVMVRRSVVVEGDLVGIGRHLLVLRDGMLDHYVDDRATLSAIGIGVTVDEGKVLLSDVTFTAEPGQLVAVVGPSGAGKSTLLRALVGTLHPSQGTVLYNGRDVHQSVDELLGRVGYVPQDDILHVDLTTKQALNYAAELRFSEETTPDERGVRVDAVIADLGLTQRAELPISRLSGGQRKRASVALELLTEPALLFLDEPTSGLDPGLERSVMELLRQLADGGRTVLVITHAVTSLELCDRVLALAPGGAVTYYGPPAAMLDMFVVDDYPEVFRQLERDGAQAVARWRDSDAFGDYVGNRIPTEVPKAPEQGRVAGRRAGAASQLSTLARRYAAVLRANRGSSLLLLLQAPMLALIILVSLGRLELGVPSDQPPRSLLMVVVLAAIAMGLANSTREIVRELQIVRRERLVGLSTYAYLGSKLLVLGVVCAAQSIILTLFVFVFQRGTARSVILPSMIELSMIVFLAMFAAVCMGLMISALVRTDAAALVLVPVVLIAQLVLANAVIDVERTAPLRVAAFLSPSYWSYAGAAASTDLLDLDLACRSGQAVRGGPPCSMLWQHGTGHLAFAVLMLLVLSGAYLVLASFGLRRSTGA